MKFWTLNPKPYMPLDIMALVDPKVFLGLGLMGSVRTDCANDGVHRNLVGFRV